MYCTVVLDTFSRRVVGWSIDASPTAALTTNALAMARAIGNRSPRPGDAIIPSAHGVQFGSWAFTQRARASGLLPSMGSIRDCVDNAMMESFWARVQVELLNRRRWRTRLELKPSNSTPPNSGESGDSTNPSTAQFRKRLRLQARAKAVRAVKRCLVAPRIASQWPRRSRGGREPAIPFPNARQGLVGVSCLTRQAAACTVGMRRRCSAASLCRSVPSPWVAGGPDAQERLIRWSSTWW
ncbi:transposase [Streptomyces sp. NPDC087859]|uniref:transposase n=1 Tax=Streptomyces sp. NPDC087859 TaxID=3365812 RepID=UPI0037FE0220